MKVYLLSAYDKPEPNFGPNWLIANSRTVAHQLVDGPHDADLIIFVETLGYDDIYFTKVLRHPIYRAHSHKCVMYHIDDSAVTFCKTVSPSVEKNQPNSATRRSFHYIARIRANDVLERLVPTEQPTKYLFSFVGSPFTHETRPRILALKHPRAFLKAFDGTQADNAQPAERRRIQSSFVDSIVESKFVLCPRGIGPTSMRLFEVMQLGRVPVIIGDSWQPIPDIDWHSCAVFVSESNIESIPKLLEQKEEHALAMGRRAAAVWQEHFSPEKSLDALIAAASHVQSAALDVKGRLRNLTQILPPRHWRNLLSYGKRFLLGTI